MTSAALDSNYGSFDSMYRFIRCGRSPARLQARATNIWLIPKCCASLRVVQCVLPSDGAFLVADKIFDSSFESRTLTVRPLYNGTKPPNRPVSKRFFQRLIVGAVTSTIFWISKYFVPFESSRITRARRTSSARDFLERQIIRSSRRSCGTNQIFAFMQRLYTKYSCVTRH